jgi:CheY-like chemotaxis protein
MAGEKILDIDDSPTVQRLIEMILASQGYKVVLASDGEEGIAMARSERPALILVDFVMPKMNGFQVCKTLKEDPEFKDTPIILVTSKGDKVGSKFVDVLGISEYFTKPFQPEELLAKIREVLDRRKAATPPPPPPVREVRPPVPPPPREVPRSYVPPPPLRETPRAFEPPPPREVPRTVEPAHVREIPRPQVHAPVSPPHHPAATGIEATIREIITQVLDEFIATALPDLIRKELARTPHATSAGIKGNLAGFRIVEVMQMLSMQRQTGILTIHSSSEAMEIYFREGAVVFSSGNRGDLRAGLDVLLRKSCRVDSDSLQHALSIANMTGEQVDKVLIREKLIDGRTYADCLRRHTESLVYKAMAWKEGDFSFENAAPPVFAVPLQIKVDDLLLEGARRSDEWTLIQQKIPNLNMVFEPMIGNAEELTTRGMSDTDLKVFSLIDGRRTVQDIIDADYLGEFDVAKSIFILLSVNLIRRKR